MKQPLSSNFFGSVISFLAFGLFFIPFESSAQEDSNIPECQVAYISEYVISNQSADTVYVSYDNINQDSFPTNGPTEVMVLPSQDKVICDLEWAGEFRTPVMWYTFELLENGGTNNINNDKKWLFQKNDDYKASYVYTIKR